MIARLGLLAQKSHVLDPSTTFSAASKDLAYAYCTSRRAALMAPMAVSASQSLKRTSSVAEFDEPTAKKLNRGPVRHHKATWNHHRQARHAANVLNDEDVQSLLIRSISLALQAVGFEAATPEAIDSFRGNVEECMRETAAL